MKKSTKLGIGGFIALLGATVLSGCTQSFCSTDDKAHICYMYDFGVSEYYNEQNAENTRLPVRGFNNLFAAVNRPTDSNSGIGKADSTATKNGYGLPTDKYLVEFDTVVLQHAVTEYYNLKEEPATSAVKFEDVPASYISKVAMRTDANKDDSLVFVQDILDDCGYLKFADRVNEKQNKLFANYDEYANETRTLVATNVLTLDDLPSSEYVANYKSGLSNTISQYRSCIAITTDKYGYYGYGSNKDKTLITGKTWGDAWKKGFFEGLLVYPIAWCVDQLSNAFMGAGAGWAQLLAILVVTVVLRTIMLFTTGKQSEANAKMTALQPEIQKIQGKYPNANTNQYEKQRMAEDMQKLYKKHGINPLGSLIPMIIQFPVFICVWGGLQGAACLSSDTFLGLYLSMSVRDALFDKVMWTSAGGYGAITALVLFILLAVGQVISMLLPQWLQKRAAKSAARLGKNPAQKSQNNQMKWFMIIMAVMIIFMSFTIASAMGVYWLVGSLFQIGQTLVMNKITEKKKQKR